MASSIPSLARLSQELGVTVDILVTGKPSILPESIAAIKADTQLFLESKRALIGLKDELHSPNAIHK